MWDMWAICDMLDMQGMQDHVDISVLVFKLLCFHRTMNPRWCNGWDTWAKCRLDSQSRYTISNLCHPPNATVCHCLS